MHDVHLITVVRPFRIEVGPSVQDTRNDELRVGPNGLIIVDGLDDFPDDPVRVPVAVVSRSGEPSQLPDGTRVEMELLLQDRDPMLDGRPMSYVSTREVARAAYERSRSKPLCDRRRLFNEIVGRRCSGPPDQRGLRMELRPEPFGGRCC